MTPLYILAIVAFLAVLIIFGEITYHIGLYTDRNNPARFLPTVHLLLWASITSGILSALLVTELGLFKEEGPFVVSIGMCFFYIIAGVGGFALSETSKKEETEKNKNQ